MIIRSKLNKIGLYLIHSPWTGTVTVPNRRFRIKNRNRNYVQLGQFRIKHFGTVQPAVPNRNRPNGITRSNIRDRVEPLRTGTDDSNVKKLNFFFFYKFCYKYPHPPLISSRNSLQRSQSHSLSISFSQILNLVLSLSQFSNSFSHIQISSSQLSAYSSQTHYSLIFLLQLYKFTLLLVSRL